MHRQARLPQYLHPEFTKSALTDIAVMLGKGKGNAVIVQLSACMQADA